LLAASDRLDGLLGSVAALVTVHASYETAISAAFGAAADAVAVAGLDAAVVAFDHLKTEDLGRAGLLLAGPEPTEQPADWPRLPDGARYAVEVVDVPAEPGRRGPPGAAQGGGGGRSTGRPAAGGRACPT
jgi:chromosome segregation protein